MKLTRRNFLQSSGLIGGSLTLPAASYGLPPVAQLASYIIEGAVARAENAETIDRNFLNINLFASPNRWVFDQFLKVRSTDNVDPARMAVTRFTSTNGAFTDAEYATVDYKGVQVPPIWLTNVRSANGTRSLTELLEHMIVIRGYGSGVDGHPGNLVKQFMPLPSAGSTTGNVADRTKSLMKAIQFPSHLSGLTSFASPQGLGASAIGFAGDGSNALKSLMNPFDKRAEAQNLEMVRSKYKDLVEKAQAILNQHVVASSPQMSAVQSDQASAARTLREGLEDLDAAWGALYNKYKTIVEDTYKDRTVPGFTDQAIPARDQAGAFETEHSLGLGIVYYPTVGFDIRNFVNTARLEIMAQSFAMAEFVFTRKISNAMEVGAFEPGSLTGTFGRDSSNPNYSGPSTFAFGVNFDEHSSGRMTSLFLDSCLFRAIGAGMAELVSVLKARGLFEKTVIQLTTEFGRAPRRSGGGSDHGFDSMISSLYTGQRTGGPLVLGNIQRSGTSGIYGPDYAGTFGWKAPTTITGAGTTVLQPSHVASSLAVLMGFKHNPWANTAAPLLYLDNGQVIGKATADVV